MKYLHFTRINKDWFYIMNSTNKNITFIPPTISDLNGWTKMLNIHSKTAALTELKKKFPNCEPIFTTSKVNTSNKTPFQKKDHYRKSERRFKNRMGNISAEDEKTFDEESYNYDNTYLLDKSNIDS